MCSTGQDSIVPCPPLPLRPPTHPPTRPRPSAHRRLSPTPHTAPAPPWPPQTRAQRRPARPGAAPGAPPGGAPPPGAAPAHARTPAPACVKGVGGAGGWSAVALPAGPGQQAPPPGPPMPPCGQQPQRDGCRHAPPRPPPTLRYSGSSSSSSLRLWYRLDAVWERSRRKPTALASVFLAAPCGAAGSAGWGDQAAATAASVCIRSPAPAAALLPCRALHCPAPTCGVAATSSTWVRDTSIPNSVSLASRNSCRSGLDRSDGCAACAGRGCGRGPCGCLPPSSAARHLWSLPGPPPHPPRG